LSLVVTDIFDDATGFSQYCFDFCCGGIVSIENAFYSSNNVDLNTLLNDLNNIRQSSINDGFDIKYLNAPSLIQYIQSRYHETLRYALKKLTPYITKLSKVHGTNNPYLLQLKNL